MFRKYLQILMAPDDGGGNGGEPPTPVVDDKKFTQADLDKQIEQRLGRERRKLDTEKLTLQKQIDDLKAQIESAPPAPEPAPADAKGQIELLTKQHTRVVENLNNKIVKLEADLVTEKTRRRETIRDKDLGDALQDARCTDMTAGRRYFLPVIELDETGENWVFKTKSGNHVSIKEGVTEELPAYLRPPAMEGGGSGVRQGDPSGKGTKAKKLEAEKTKLEELRVKAGRTNAQPDIMAYQRQKRLVKDLEQ